MTYGVLVDPTAPAHSSPTPIPDPSWCRRGPRRIDASPARAGALPSEGAPVVQQSSPEADPVRRRHVALHAQRSHGAQGDHPPLPRCQARRRLPRHPLGARPCRAAAHGVGPVTRAGERARAIRSPEGHRPELRRVSALHHEERCRLTRGLMGVERDQHVSGSSGQPAVEGPPGPDISFVPLGRRGRDPLTTTPVATRAARSLSTAGTASTRPMRSCRPRR